ncbi:MAG: ABC transporter substrate-binding protein [Prevotella sp.]|nr:ABC transporter substrate-binding protein [Prevotella sp.]
MRRLLLFLTVVAVFAACSQSYEEKRRTVRKERQQRLREDSVALKVAVLPTIDCLPVFVAKTEHLFSGQNVDVRLKLFTAQMDCDTALAGGSVEGAVTDLVRAERLAKQGTSLRYVAATGAYWQLYSNRMARITKLPQVDDKMIGMTRYSATALLADLAVDSAKLKPERVFKIQVNDVNIRLKMLIGGEIDAVWLTEPQASQARQARHHLLMDSREVDVRLGVVAFREKALKDSVRQRQLEVFCKGYNQAVDSLNRYGVSRYRDLMVKYCNVRADQIDSVLQAMKFQRMEAPREADIERARKWLEKQ